jgi:hypothetical protein
MTMCYLVFANDKISYSMLRQIAEGIPKAIFMQHDGHVSATSFFVTACNTRRRQAVGAYRTTLLLIKEEGDPGYLALL